MSSTPFALRTAFCSMMEPFYSIASSKQVSKQSINKQAHNSKHIHKREGNVRERCGWSPPPGACRHSPRARRPRARPRPCRCLPHGPWLLTPQPSSRSHPARTPAQAHSLRRRLRASFAQNKQTDTKTSRQVSHLSCIVCVGWIQQAHTCAATFKQVRTLVCSASMTSSSFFFFSASRPCSSDGAKGAVWLPKILARVVPTCLPGSSLFCSSTTPRLSNHVFLTRLKHLI